MTLLSPATARSAPLAPAGGRSGRVLARIATGAGLAAGSAIVLAGVLDPGYSARSEAVSALASQESASAPLMILGFFSLALALAAAGAALFGQLPGRRPRAGAALVMLSGALTVVVAVARQDCSTLEVACLARESAGTVSAGHLVHNLVSLVLFVLLVVAAFLLTPGLRRSPGSPSLARIALLVAVTDTVFLLWFGSAAFGSSGGLVQRGLVLLTFGWPVFLAAHLGRHAPVAP